MDWIGLDWIGLKHWQMASTTEPPGKPLVSSFNRRPHLLTHINDESGDSSYLSELD